MRLKMWKRESGVGVKPYREEVSYSVHYVNVLIKSRAYNFGNFSLLETSHVHTYSSLRILIMSRSDLKVDIQVPQV